MKNKEAVARHGDIDIFKVDSLPKGLQKRKTSTIAYGEATGHHHTLFAKDMKAEITTYLDQLSQKIFFEIRGGQAELRHQEHHTITLDPGMYQIDTEQEYDYFTEQIKTVID